VFTVTAAKHRKLSNVTSDVNKPSPASSADDDGRLSQKPTEQLGLFDSHVSLY